MIKADERWLYSVKAIKDGKATVADSAIYERVAKALNNDQIIDAKEFIELSNMISVAGYDHLLIGIEASHKGGEINKNGARIKVHGEWVPLVMYIPGIPAPLPVVEKEPEAKPDTTKTEPPKKPEAKSRSGIYIAVGTEFDSNHDGKAIPRIGIGYEWKNFEAGISVSYLLPYSMDSDTTWNGVNGGFTRKDFTEKFEKTGISAHIAAGIENFKIGVQGQYDMNNTTISRIVVNQTAIDPAGNERSKPPLHFPNEENSSHSWAIGPFVKASYKNVGVSVSRLFGNDQNPSWSDWTLELSYTFK